MTQENAIRQAAAMAKESKIEAVAYKDQVMGEWQFGSRKAYDRYKSPRYKKAFTVNPAGEVAVLA